MQISVTINNVNDHAYHSFAYTEMNPHQRDSDSFALWKLVNVIQP